MEELLSKLGPRFAKYKEVFAGLSLNALLALSEEQLHRLGVAVDDAVILYANLQAERARQPTGKPLSTTSLRTVKREFVILSTVFFFIQVQITS